MAGHLFHCLLLIFKSILNRTRRVYLKMKIISAEMLIFVALILNVWILRESVIDALIRLLQKLRLIALQIVLGSISWETIPICILLLLQLILQVCCSVICIAVLLLIINMMGFCQAHTISSWINGFLSKELSHKSVLTPACWPWMLVTVELRP